MKAKLWSTTFALFISACASPPVAPLTSVAPTLEMCIAGPTIPSRLREIRPSQTAVCPYDFQEVIAKIRQLGTDKSASYTVETAEQTFGLPEMTDLYSTPRLVGYSMKLSGRGGWRLNVYVSESGSRTDKGPDRFVPGLHPKRLFKPDDDFLNINLRVEGATPGLPPHPNQCIRNVDVSDILIQAGWKERDARQYPPPTDGGRSNLSLAYENKSADFIGWQRDCFINLTLSQKPL